MKSLSLLEPISVYELYAGELPDGTPRYFSPFCWAARLAIVHKSIPVKTLPWQFQESDKIAFSNQGLVPVIVDSNKDGKWTNDSWAIANYLENTYPDGKSLFGGASGEAGALFTQKWFTSSVAPHLMKLMMLCIFEHVPERLKGWFRQTREARFKMPLEEFGANDSNRGEIVASFRAACEPMRAVLLEYPFLSGTKEPNYSDIFVFSFFLFACSVSPTKLLEESDPIYAWRKRMFTAYHEQASKAVGYPDSL